MPTPSERSLDLAQKHLERVRASWSPPVWVDLATFGLYALEAAVVAGATFLAIPLSRTHWSKADAARALAARSGLPDVSPLMRELNEARKAEAYGDVAFPHGLDAADVSNRIEDFVRGVQELIGSGKER